MALRPDEMAHISALNALRFSLGVNSPLQSPPTERTFSTDTKTLGTKNCNCNSFVPHISSRCRPRKHSWQVRAVQTPQRMISWTAIKLFINGRPGAAKRRRHLILKPEVVKKRAETVGCQLLLIAPDKHSPIRWVFFQEFFLSAIPS